MSVTTINYHMLCIITLPLSLCMASNIRNCNHDWKFHGSIYSYSYVPDASLALLAVYFFCARKDLSAKQLPECIITLQYVPPYTVGKQTISFMDRIATTGVHEVVATSKDM